MGLAPIHPHYKIFCTSLEQGNLFFIASEDSLTLNPFPNNPWFLRVCSRGLLKTLWEKEILLVTSYFSFSHSDFYPFGKLLATFINFEIVVCKLFQFGRLWNLLFGKEVTKRQILDSSKLKEFADEYFKFEENGRKLTKLVENTVGKGEIDCNEQFLLFPQCFQKACIPGASKGVIGNGLTLNQKTNF